MKFYKIVTEEELSIVYEGICKVGKQQKWSDIECENYYKDFCDRLIAQGWEIK